MTQISRLENKYITITILGTERKMKWEVVLIAVNPNLIILTVNVSSTCFRRECPTQAQRKKWCHVILVNGIDIICVYEISKKKVFSSS